MIIQITKKDEYLLKYTLNILNSTVSFGLWNYESILKFLDSGGEIWGYKKNQILVGVITIKKEKNYIEVKHVAVLKEERKKGIASKLLDFVLNRYANYKKWNAIGWEKPNGWDAEKLFFKRGFVIKDIKELWKKECNSTSFCPYYHKKCRCRAVYIEKIYT